MPSTKAQRSTASGCSSSPSSQSTGIGGGRLRSRHPSKAGLSERWNQSLRSCSVRRGPPHSSAECRMEVESLTPLRELAAARCQAPSQRRTAGTASVGPVRLGDTRIMHQQPTDLAAPKGPSPAADATQTHASNFVLEVERHLQCQRDLQQPSVERSLRGSRNGAANASRELHGNVPHRSHHSSVEARWLELRSSGKL